MEDERGYWTFDEQGRYVWVPLTKGSRRSTGQFLADWFRHSALAFGVLMGLLFLFWSLPFPHIEWFGIILHP